MPTQTTTADNLTVIGVDIGKDAFHIVGFDGDGKIVLRRKVKRLEPTRHPPSLLC